LIADHFAIVRLPVGVASHDSINRVIPAFDAEEKEGGFAAWVALITKLTAGEMVAIDGKMLCGTRKTGKKALVHRQFHWIGNAGDLGRVMPASE
jgi:hypothetical protein